MGATTFPGKKHCGAFRVIGRAFCSVIVDDSYSVFKEHIGDIHKSRIIALPWSLWFVLLSCSDYRILHRIAIVNSFFTIFLEKFFSCMSAGITDASKHAARCTQQDRDRDRESIGAGESIGTGDTMNRESVGA